MSDVVMGILEWYRDFRFSEDGKNAISALNKERERATRIEAAADKMFTSKTPGDWLEATMEYAEAKGEY